MRLRTISAVLAAGAAMITTTFAADTTDQSRRIGKIERANELIGRNVINRQDQKIGDLSDFVVDLESGRILYTLVSSGGFLGVGDQQSAVPPGLFRVRDNGRQLVLDIDKEKLQSAPKFNRERAENLDDAAFVREIYSHYDQPARWLGTGSRAKLGNVHRASKLLKADVYNRDDERIGTAQNLAVDFPSRRVLYVILNPTRDLDGGAGLYALPPMAFTAGRGEDKLVTDLNKSRLSSAPHFRQGDWQEITTPSYASKVYRFYGKPLYWEGDEVSSAAARDRDDVISRDRDDDRDTVRDREARQEGRSERRQARESAQTAARDNAFGPMIGADKLSGWEVQGPGGRKIGTLQDMVVDLETGRLLYGVVDERGLGAHDNYAVAPGAFRRVNEADKVLVAEFGAKKLNEAPVVPRDRAEYASPSFGAKVYDFYGEQPWWTDRNPSATGRDAGSGKFGNVHRTSDLIGMKIENSSGEDLGKVQNVMVDLPDGRVGYVLMSARNTGRGAGDLIVIPPMAITVGSEGRTLVTDLSADKLQSAPHVSRDQVDKLDDASFASEVYRFYGKDTWWRGTGTGRE